MAQKRILGIALLAIVLGGFGFFLGAPAQAEKTTPDGWESGSFKVVTAIPCNPDRLQAAVVGQRDGGSGPLSLTLTLEKVTPTGTFETVGVFSYTLSPSLQRGQYELLPEVPLPGLGVVVLGRVTVREASMGDLSIRAWHSCEAPIESQLPPATPTTTATVTQSPSPTGTVTSTPSATATQMATETATATVTPTVAETATPSATPLPTETSTATATSTAAATSTPSATPSATATETQTPFPTATATITATPEGGAVVGRLYLPKVVRRSR